MEGYKSKKKGFFFPLPFFPHFSLFWGPFSGPSLTFFPRLTFAHPFSITLFPFPPPWLFPPTPRYYPLSPKIGSERHAGPKKPPGEPPKGRGDARANPPPFFPGGPSSSSNGGAGPPHFFFFMDPPGIFFFPRGKGGKPPPNGGCFWGHFARRDVLWPLHRWGFFSPGPRVPPTRGFRPLFPKRGPG